jgi:hypothetical protein
MRLHAWHGFALRQLSARGGSDVPAGDRRRPKLGRRFPLKGASLPLVSRPEGRPGASVERGRFCWLNCERGGPPWGAWGGTTSKPDVVPSLSPLTIVFRCVPRRSRRAGVPEQNRRRAIGTEECRDASVANGWSTWCATALLLGLECPEQELYSSSRVDVHNIP